MFVDLFLLEVGGSVHSVFRLYSLDRFDTFKFGFIRDR